jgi:manganese efflux pump family protein
LNFFTSFLIAIGLAMDAFAVSLGVGTMGRSNTPRSIFRLAFHFGIFQAFMPILGWLAGMTIDTYIRSFDHWIAFLLLSYVGGKMIYEGARGEKEEFHNDPSKGKMLVILAVATSIDALAVGLSLAMIDVPVILPAILIGVVTFSLSLAGLLLGNRLGVKFGQRVEILGGLILIGIGIRILTTHLFV